LAGWSHFEPWYKSAFSSGSVLALTLGGTAGLACAAVTYPKEQNMKTKLGLWIGSALNVGFLAVPLFFSPGSVMTIAGGYTIGLMVPLSISAIVANNFVFFNSCGAFSMLLSTLLVGTQLRNAKFGGLLSKIITGGLFVSVTTTAATLLYNMNLLIGRMGSEEAEEKEPTQSWTQWLMKGVDPSDEIAFGYIIALSWLYAYAKLLYDIGKMTVKATVGLKKRRGKND